MGLEDGLTVGTTLGDTVGLVDGLTVGTTLGETVGDPVVGLKLGANVSFGLVGDCVVGD